MSWLWMGRATIAGIGAVALASASWSAERTKDWVPEQRTGVIAAQAPYARVAALIKNGGTLLRSKRIARVTRVATGRYCIDPSIEIDVNRAIVVATVDWSHSLPGSDADLVQWRSTGADCAPGSFEVLTFRNSSGNFVPSDAVAFSFVVP